MINSDMFPSLHDGVQGKWAPVFFEPISGSYERFVVGVAVVGKDDYYLEIANSLDRLKCFYGEDAIGAIRAVHIAGEYLEADLARRAAEALVDPDPAVTGIVIGEMREAEGESLKTIAQSWMSALSSLYQDQKDGVLVSNSLEQSTFLLGASGDRLPFLICDYVKRERDGLANFFSNDLQEGQRRTKGSSHKVVIDFSGSKIVANFGTLKAGKLTSSVNLIKRRLWDLKVKRDEEPSSFGARRHEMILQRPSVDDPQITEKQQTNLSEAFGALKHQAGQEELRLRALYTVQDIGDHILSAEAA